MDYRYLGKSGLKVSTVGVGCNNFGSGMDQAATSAVVNKALDVGITLFDTADCYGQTKSEEFLGKALGARRMDVIVATKFGIPLGTTFELRGGGSRDYIVRAAEASLRRLGTDYIDLYQYHTPDANTPIEETMSALDTLVRQGKVRYIGHSNFTGGMTADAAWTAKTKNLTPFVSAQNRYSLLTRDIERDLVLACEAHGVGILPYFPLESGLLSGKYKRNVQAGSDTRFAKWGTTGMMGLFNTDQKFMQVEKLEEFAAANGCTMLNIAFGWLLNKPYISSVIAGATKPEQIEQNAKAAEWRPTADQLKQIDTISPPLPGPLG